MAGSSSSWNSSSNAASLSETFKTRLAAFGKASAEVGRKVSERATFGVGRVKEMFAAPTAADRLVEDATAETLVGPDWAKNLELCDQVNQERVPSLDAVRAMKKRIVLRHFHVQLLALTLLETAAKNCERLFADVAAEKVLDEMVRIVDDPGEPREVRDKALVMIESWGEAAEELRYLPVFEETYKSLKSRGIRFPGRDADSLGPIFTPPQSVPIAPRPPRDAGGDGNGVGGGAAAADAAPLSAEDSQEALTTARNGAELLTTVLTSAPPKEALQDELTGTLVSQCRASQSRVQRIIESAGDNEGLMFEALSVHDELEKVLALRDKLLEEAGMGGGAQGPPAAAAPDGGAAPPPEVATIPVQAEPAELKDLRAGEEDESAAAAGASEGLVRNRAAKAPGAGQPGDEEAMKDLDDMIFGKEEAAGSRAANKDAKDAKDDMIVF